MAERVQSFGAGPSWPTPIGSAIEITERGLVYAGGSVLVRMRKSEDGRQDLATGTDRGRVLAMLSIAFGRPVAAHDVLPHVETASNHWRRGEKALANLRLAFAGLTQADDPSAGARVALAAYLLDQGWPPAALLEELGLAPHPTDVTKYNHFHVPAGNGPRSGQFDFRSTGASAAGRGIIVAGEENDKQFEILDLLGEANPKEDIEHHRPPPSPMGPPIPFMGGAVFAPKPTDAVSAAAKAAAAKVGPGKGPAYGTAAHTELKQQIKALGRDDLHTEQSYLNGKKVDYGTPGSVRVDVLEGSKERPDGCFDLKTGGARLTRSRIKQLQSHLPLREDGTPVPICELRP